MRVFIAGGSGALGIPVTRRLVERGHEVVALTHRANRRAQAVAAGASVVTADALDRTALYRVVSEARPDAVVHALTALPARGVLRPGDFRKTNDLRITGTRNLLEAAIGAGAKHFVAESNVFIYGFGDLGTEPITEAHAVGVHVPEPWLRDPVKALIAEEEQLDQATASGAIRTVALRFGAFYGRGAGTDQMVRQLRRRLLLLPQTTPGLLSWIHIEDAASAVVAALDVRATGAFNIVDDRPTSLSDFVRHLAAVARVPNPLPLPLWALRVIAPFATVAFMQTTILVSNEKAKRGLGWTLRYPSYREGTREFGPSNVSNS